MMLLLALLLSIAAAPRQEAETPKRPRDPWVFRCVLDKRPRMVTVALSDEMWVAYDTTTCGMYKAWRGGVNFDGPVYTTVHGPQPTTLGKAYIEGIEGDVWSASVGGKDGPAMAVWRGYRLNGNHVALEYDIVLEDGRKVAVQESPEFVRPEQMFDDARLEELVLQKGHPGLFRSFLARDLPDGVKLSLEMRTDGVTGKLAETLERERFVDVTDEKGEKKTQVVSHLALSKERPTSTVVLFFAPIEIQPEPKKESK
jgi:cytochrome c